MIYGNNFAINFYNKDLIFYVSKFETFITKSTIFRKYEIKLILLLSNKSNIMTHIINLTKEK